jgi:hypothetical protein
VQDPHVGDSALVKLEDKVCGHHSVADGQTDGLERLQHFNATYAHGAAGLEKELSERPVHWGNYDDLAQIAELAFDEVEEHLVGAGDGKVLRADYDVAEHLALEATKKLEC